MTIIRRKKTLKLSVILRLSASIPLAMHRTREKGLTVSFFPDWELYNQPQPPITSLACIHRFPACSRRLESLRPAGETNSIRQHRQAKANNGELS